MDENLELLVNLLEIKLTSCKQYDMFTCELVRVYKLSYGDTYMFLRESDYNSLKKLGIKSYDYD